jgi:hypothetical protein
MSDKDFIYGRDRMEDRRNFRKMLDDFRDDDGTPPKTVPKLLPPLVYDVGPIHSSRDDNAAVQRHEDRITALDRRDRGR